MHTVYCKTCTENGQEEEIVEQQSDESDNSATESTDRSDSGRLSGRGRGRGGGRGSRTGQGGRKGGHRRGQGTGRVPTSTTGAILVEQDRDEGKFYNSGDATYMHKPSIFTAIYIVKIYILHRMEIGGLPGHCGSFYG